MKAISPFSPMGQRPVSVSPRTSLYHVIDLSTSVRWMPTCPTRLIVNPLAILILLAAGSALIRHAQGHSTDTALTRLPLALGYASNGEYHSTDFRGLYQAQHAQAYSVCKT